MNLNRQFLTLIFALMLALAPTVGAASAVENASRWGSIDRLLTSLATVAEAVWDTGTTLIGSTSAEFSAQDSTVEQSPVEATDLVEEQTGESQTLSSEHEDEMGGYPDPFG